MTENDSTSSGQHYELDQRSLAPQQPQRPPVVNYRPPIAPSWPPAPAYRPVSPAMPQPPGARPSTVTAAGLTILGTVVLALAGGAMLLFPGKGAGNSTFTAVSGILHLVIALGFIAVSLGVFQGRNGGRVTAFVIYALAMLINGCLGSILLLAVEIDDDPMTWQGLIFTFIMVVMTFADAMVIILLALAPSNRWFRAMSRARKQEVLRHPSAMPGRIR